MKIYKATVWRLPRLPKMATKAEYSVVGNWTYRILNADRTSQAIRPVGKTGG